MLQKLRQQKRKTIHSINKNADQNKRKKLNDKLRYMESLENNLKKLESKDNDKDLTRPLHDK